MTDADAGPAAYTGGEQFQRERHTLFAQSWLLFAASGQLPASGDFVTHSYGGWPLFAIRGGDGEARAFHNICRHQRMPVVEQPTGKCDALRCRYHGWTYGLDGAFREAPPRVMPAEPPEQLGLEAITLAEQGGLCLVRVRPGEEMPPELGLAGRRFATALVTNTDANWKAVVETLLTQRGARFVWPAAFVAEAGPAAIVRQIVPRSFSRTRLVDLIFLPDGTPTDNLAALRQATAATDKIAAEACQARHAAGMPPDPTAAVTDFLRQVGAACS